MSADARTDSETYARALALLEATHQFPCEYAITVIALNSEAVATAILNEARATGVGVDKDRQGVPIDIGNPGASDYQTRASSQGKYLSHRFSVHVRAASEVVELHARLRAIEGVVSIL